MKKIEVLLVDDHPLIRDGLRNIIDAQSDMKVIGEAENGTQALKMIHEIKPCVVILDIALPDFNGLEIAAQIQKFGLAVNRPIYVIILSMFLKENLVYQALQNGAKGYILKTASSLEVIQGIRSVCQGGHYLCSQVSTSIIPEYLKGHAISQPDSPYNLLTDREQQIFRLLAEGHSNREISEFLHISCKTVERHRANIMTKLDLHSYHSLLRFAIDIGIIEVIEKS